MLISFFKKSFITQYAALIFIQCLLWLPAFLAPENFQKSFVKIEAPAYQLIEWIFGDRQFVSILFAFLLIMFSGFLINYSLTRHGLAPKNSLLPAFLFYLLAAHQPWLLQLHPGLIPTVILILVLYLLFDLYVERNAYSHVFHTGFFLAIASLFYSPMIFFVPMVFFTFVVYSLFEWREWVIFILGFMCVFLFAATAYFWFDDLPELLGWLASLKDKILWIKLPSISLLGIIIEGMLLLFILLAMYVLGNRINEKIISIRKRYWSVIWTFFISLISFILSGINAEFHLLLLILPIAIIVSFYLSEIHKTRWQNILLLTFFVLILINNFYSIIQNRYF